MQTSHELITPVADSVYANIYLKIPLLTLRLTIRSQLKASHGLSHTETL